MPAARRLAFALALALPLISYAAMPAPAAPPASAPPAAAPAAGTSGPVRLDLNVLVLDDGDSGVAAVASRLDEEGVPYTRVALGDAARPTVTAAFLTGTDAGGRYGKFSGVVLPNESPSGLSADELAALAAYERGFGVRQVVSYTWPNPALGFDWPQWSGVVDGMATSVTAPGKAAGWGYLAGPVSLDDGDPVGDESYGYLAPALPADQLQPGQTFTPLLTAPIPGSTDPGVLMGAFTDNGQESLVLAFANNQWLTHFKVLGHGVVSWLTRGVSGGIYRNWFSIHTDDVFLPDDRWSVPGHCTRGADCDPDEYPSDITNWIRMKPADVTNLVAWQRRSGIKIDQAFNGFGSGKYAQDSGKPDRLLPAMRSNAGSLRFLNHTWSHPYLGCVQDWSSDPWRCKTNADGSTKWVGADVIENQIAKNLAWGKANGLPVRAAELVTGEHSGLKSSPQMPVDNPNLAIALRRTGVQWIASDASRETDVRRVGSALTVPRHPMNIFYNVGTKAEEIAEYNWIYTSREDGGSGYCTDHPATETCIEPLDPVTGFDDYIAPIETRIAFSHIAANDPMPHYAHQSNLTEDRILYPVLDSILAHYKRTYAANTPVVNPTHAAAGTAMNRLADWRTAKPQVRIRLEGRRVTVTNSGPSSVSAPLTFPTGTRKATGAGFGAAYAGSSSGWLRIAAGASVAFTLPADPGFATG